MTLFSSVNEDFGATLTKNIKEYNWLYVNENVLSNYSEEKELLGNVFPENPLTPKEWINGCQYFITQLKGVFQHQKNALELEYLYRFHTLFNQLEQYLDSVEFVSELKSIKSF